MLAGVLALGVTAALWSPLWAQQGATGTQQGATSTQTTQSAQTRGTKVAVLNLAKVINSYKKWDAFKEEYKAEYKRLFEDKVAPMKDRMESLDKEIKAATTTPERKEAATKELNHLQRQVQEIAEDAKTALGKKEADQFVQLYREVRDAVTTIATYYSIEIVMHYNDAFDAKDLDTPQNVARKMGHPGCMPLYINASCDISSTVIEYLNRAYAQKPAASTATPASYQTPPAGKQ
jgi:Skp family chaperone for outer membrane proteins